MEQTIECVRRDGEVFLVRGIPPYEHGFYDGIVFQERPVDRWIHGGEGELQLTGNVHARQGPFFFTAAASRGAKDMAR